MVPSKHNKHDDDPPQEKVTLPTSAAFTEMSNRISLSLVTAARTSFLQKLRSTQQQQSSGSSGGASTTGGSFTSLALGRTGAMPSTKGHYSVRKPRPGQASSSGGDIDDEDSGADLFRSALAPPSAGVGAALSPAAAKASSAAAGTEKLRAQLLGRKGARGGGGGGRQQQGKEEQHGRGKKRGADATKGGGGESSSDEEEGRSGLGRRKKQKTLRRDELNSPPEEMDGKRLGEEGEEETEKEEMTPGGAKVGNDGKGSSPLASAPNAKVEKKMKKKNKKRK